MIGWIDQHRDTGGLGDQIMEEPQPLGRNLAGEKIDPGGVAARLGKAGDETKFDGVVADAEDDRDRCGRSPGRLSNGGLAGRSDNGYAPADEVSHERRQAIVSALQPVVFDHHVLALDVAGFVEGFAERSRIAPTGLGRRCLPPVEFCRGTRPSQAANSRPLRKPLGSTTVAAMAVAMIGPMPGMLARRWLTGLLLCQAMSCFSIAATAASSCSICAASTCNTWRAKSGSRASRSSRTMAISLPTLRKPCGAITPNSARCPRKAFTRPVRWRTSRSRPRCSSTAACWSAVLTGTKRIVGRPTASQIASASAASCLLRLMYAFTYCAGISRTSWPSARNSRAQ